MVSLMGDRSEIETNQSADIASETKATSDGCGGAKAG